jgi:hypothetical protein
MPRRWGPEDHGAENFPAFAEQPEAVGVVGLAVQVVVADDQLVGCRLVEFPDREGATGREEPRR